MKKWVFIVCAATLLSGCKTVEKLANPFNASTGWEQWSKSSAAVYTGPSRIISDPTVIPDESVFRLVYTSVDLTDPNPHATLSLATSTDSLSWAPVPNATGDGFRGEILGGRDGQWDENLETPFLMKTLNGYYLYYSGYRDGMTSGEPAKGLPASLGVATSRDGVTFTRLQSEPILTPTEGSFDADAIYSPDIIPYESGYLMVYAGHCYKHCPGAPGVRILAATSPDGIHWTKLDQPLLSAAPTPAWMRDGVAEPAILLGPDGDLYLFFTGVQGPQHVIGVARAASLTSAWDINPDPIAAPTAGGFDEAGDVAPTVVLEDGVVRMWFSATNSAGQYSIGYAEAPWPLRHAPSHSSRPVFALGTALGQ
ncbi:MAG: hypothetical protein WBL70_10830 [Candidatus Acidiferrales bacterium]